MTKKIYFEASPGELPEMASFKTDLEHKAQRQDVLRVTVEMICLMQGILKLGEQVRLLNPSLWAKEALVELPDGRKLKATLTLQSPWIEESKSKPAHWGKSQAVPDEKEDTRPMWYRLQLEEVV